VRLPGPLRPLASRGSFARAARLAVALAGGALAGGCYEGPGPLEPPPGSPGGLCNEPLGTCDQPNWRCEAEGRYCFDVATPCRGVFCGEHGTCGVSEEGLPVCECDAGYSNAAYSLYCEGP
jgi:hypothetical protein